MRRKILGLFLLCGISFASGAQPTNWAGGYAGISGGVNATTITNAKNNAFGFTAADVGVEGGYHFNVSPDFLIGMDGNINISPFTESHYLEDVYIMHNKTLSYGSLLGVMGVPLSQSNLIFTHFGVGYVKTQTTLKTATGLFSDHSGNAITPVFGGGIKHVNPLNIYYGLSANYYMPTTAQYYSTVALHHATIRRGLSQAEISIGYYFG